MIDHPHPKDCPQTPHGIRARLLDIQTSTLFADVALDQLAGLYLETASLIDALRSIQSEIKDEIGAIFVETGQTSAETSAARLTISSPGVSVRYDAKALDVLRQADPALAAILAPHRTETERAGVLTIRGKK